MTTWRDHKRRARRDIHFSMGVPALLLVGDQVVEGGPFTVRGPHTKRAITVGQDADGGGWAEREETAPRMIFWRDELPIKLTRDVIVSVEPGEAYRIGSVEPPNDQTISAEVIALSAEKAAGLPVPEVV